MGAVPVIVAIITDLAKKLPEKALDLALDPTFNEALSPSAGLQVTPITFSSVDQEGRWKIPEWNFSQWNTQAIQENRVLSNPIMYKSLLDNGSVPNPANAAVTFYPGVGAGASATKRGYGRLLTIDIPKPSSASNYIGIALAAMGSVIPAVVPVVLNNTILAEAYAEISADWQHDGLEIWGGFAGLTNAKGFGSVFGHRANVQLAGTIYGNYMPASYLITMTGNVNPLGPAYIEFRCAAVIQAGKSIQPLYGQQWDRDGKQQDLHFGAKTGFVLNLT